MWVIAEDGRGINLSMATHLEVVKSADYIGRYFLDDCPRAFAVMARFAWQSFYQVVCTRDTEEECYQAIIDMTADLCGWIDPTQQE